MSARCYEPNAPQVRVHEPKVRQGCRAIRVRARQTLERRRVQIDSIESQTKGGSWWHRKIFFTRDDEPRCCPGVLATLLLAHFSLVSRRHPEVGLQRWCGQTADVRAPFESTDVRGRTYRRPGSCGMVCNPRNPSQATSSAVTVCFTWAALKCLFEWASVAVQWKLRLIARTKSRIVLVYWAKRS